MLHAVLDTCVLFRPLLCDTLLCLAEEEMFAPLWSADILAELRRNLLRYGIAEHAVEHRIEQMSIHFPAANVTGYEPLVAGMLISPSDRHVLAAAVRGHADVIVTENVKDFPAEHVELYDVAVSHQDVFLLDSSRPHPSGIALPPPAAHGARTARRPWQCWQRVRGIRRCRQSRVALHRLPEVA
jgi:predicted nucleic acid-binding protein